MPTENTINLTLNIKDRTEPITIQVPPSMTPKEIIDDLQAQEQVPRFTDRNVAMTHGKTNLQPDVPMERQGVGDGDAVSIVWDGRLAGGRVS
jgi:hypothetical protein